MLHRALLPHLCLFGIALQPPKHTSAIAKMRFIQKTLLEILYLKWTSHYDHHLYSVPLKLHADLGTFGGKG